MIRNEPLAELEGREEASYLMTWTRKNETKDDKAALKLELLELLKKVEEKKKQIEAMKHS